MKRVLTGWCLVALSCFAPWALAQQYPTKPIRFIVPWSAGSGTDLMARAFAQELEKALGQRVIVDNRGGAGATIGTQAAAKTTPDGYSIYIGGAVSMAISPALYARVGYDPIGDFAPVSLVAQFYNALGAHPSLPVKSVRDLIALAKRQPGEILMGSAGVGSTSHLAGELFKSTAGVDLRHVPYKGGGELGIGLLSGEVYIGFPPVGVALPHYRAGKLRLLGVSSAKRVGALPEVPTISETVPGFHASGWQGILVPAGTSQEIIARLNAAAHKAAAGAGLREYLARVGSEVTTGSPAEFHAFIKDEVVKYTKLVQALGLQQK
jgi:tripartite-type tricarboxylate transporter receptor subunit TctC